MDKKTLIDNIVELIPSSSLKRYIRENEIELDIVVLMQIIDAYAHSYNERISLLKALQEYAEEDALNAIISLIEKCERNYNCYFEFEKDEVFELRIKLCFNDYNEKFFCKSFDTAVNTVKAFLDEYENWDELTEHSQIIINKWRIFDDEIDFNNNELGCAELNEQLELKCVEHYEDIIEVETKYIYDFSDFLDEFNPIKHISYDGEVTYYAQIKSFRGYAYVNLESEEKVFLADEVYAIPIDSELDFEQNIFSYYHQHIPVYEIELLNEEELDDFMRDNYRKLVSFIKENYFEED